MTQRGKLTGADVEGPHSSDIATSEEAARTKDLTIDCRCRQDILIVPNMEAGNVLYKLLVYPRAGQ